MCIFFHSSFCFTELLSCSCRATGGKRMNTSLEAYISGYKPLTPREMHCPTTNVISARTICKQLELTLIKPPPPKQFPSVQKEKLPAESWVMVCVSLGNTDMPDQVQGQLTATVTSGLSNSFRIHTPINNKPQQQHIEHLITVNSV